MVRDVSGKGGKRKELKEVSSERWGERKGWKEGMATEIE